MADIFISYARSTAKQAQAIAEALRAQGYGVWLDDAIPAHRAYADVIEEELKAAAAVVVVWSAEAVKSQWVQSEADHARATGKLVQLNIDGAVLPMPFDRIQCADLTGWTGDPEAPGWRRVAASIATLTGGAARTAPAAAAAPVVEPLPQSQLKPSIAVVPFANLSNDPEQDYFVDGVVEEIVSALSRFKSIFVISAGDSLVSDGKAMSPQDAARELGVRYVLEGSVRKAGGRVRITVHLVDASNGAEIWADRLDDTMEDVFALQDRVAARVAGVIETAMEEMDEVKATTRPTANISSYDLYLRSLSLFRISQKAEILAAIDLLDQAIALDPNFALAMSQSSVCHRQVIDHGWADDPDKVRRRGLELAERGLRLAGEDPRVMASVAIALPGLEGRLDRAVALMNRALALNPASSFLWLVSGSLQLKNGQPDLAAEQLETAMRLDPISQMNAFARMYLASARFQQGRLDEALALFMTTSSRLPVSYAVLAALYGLRGEIDQAREALAQFKSLMIGTIDEAARIWFPRPEHRKLFLDGLALAEGEGPAA
jgi:TolB-like protein